MFDLEHRIGNVDTKELKERARVQRIGDATKICLAHRTCRVTNNA